MTIKRDINKLIPPKARGKKRLAPLSGNRSIAMSRGVGKPAAESASSLIFNERNRSFYSTVRELRSSDGLFVLQWRNIAQIVCDRGTFNYRDYDPDA